MVCHIQAASSIKVGRCVLARTVSADRLLGVDGSRASAATGVVSRSQVSLYVEPEVVLSAVGPMMKTALLILVIELALIGWVRWRQRARNQGEAGARRSRQPPEHERLWTDFVASERSERATRAERGSGVPRAPDSPFGLRRGLTALRAKAEACRRGFGGRSPPDEEDSMPRASTFLSITRDYSNRAVASASRWARRARRSWSAATSTRQLHDYRFRQMEYTLPEEHRRGGTGAQRKIHDSLITMGLKLISDSYLDSMSRLCAASRVSRSSRG